MKRPQFGLRLMLLVVALIAVAVAAGRALFDVRQLGTGPQRVNLESELERLESYKRHWQREIMASDQASDPQNREYFKKYESKIDDEIARVKKLLEELDP